jgi:hypothetical protein
MPLQPKIEEEDLWPTKDIYAFQLMSDSCIFQHHSAKECEEPTIASQYQIEVDILQKVDLHTHHHFLILII